MNYNNSMERNTVMKWLTVIIGFFIIVCASADSANTGAKWTKVLAREFHLHCAKDAKSDTTEPTARILPEFSRLAHKLRSGPIVVLDSKTFYIPNLHYDGLGPDAYFWAGNGTDFREGVKVPNELGNVNVLKAYSGKNIEIVLPDDLTVHNIERLGLWCITYKHNFGFVSIPKGLNVPEDLGQTNISLATNKLEKCFQPFDINTMLWEKLKDPLSNEQKSEVFMNYCNETKSFGGCVSNFLTEVESCGESIEGEEKSSVHLFQNVTNALVDFTCADNNATLSQLIEDAGLECLQKNTQAIIDCFKTTYSQHIPVSVLTTQDCKDLKNVQKCVVSKIETCKKPKAVKSVESFFNNFYEATICNTPDVLDSMARGMDGMNGRASTDSSATQVLFVFFVSVLNFLVVKFY